MLLSLIVLAAEAGGDPFPWPVSLGISGISLAALISFFVWQNKNISSGKWVPGEQVIARMAEKKEAYDAMVIVKDAQLAEQAALLVEQRETIRAQDEAGKLKDELLRKSIDGNRLTDHFYATFMPKLESPPQKGDTVTEEAVQR